MKEPVRVEVETPTGELFPCKSVPVSELLIKVVSVTRRLISIEEFSYLLMLSFM